MHRTPGGIRTPDQRLRVFVSSTLKELAADRASVRASIERMGLTPVMFELGARPHPPRDLYRAYLEQSDIFVGLYGNRYGWVAPGETVSGLEDEYNLAAPGMPKLVYIKQSADGRDQRLNELLDRVRGDDRLSFKYYTDDAELGPLVAGDLAVLLAERFDRAAGSPRPVDVPAAAPKPPADALPVPLTAVIGREAESARIRQLLGEAGVRLLTLTGPGGIGKTRLAIEVAGQLGELFTDGVTYVPLASVEDPAQVPGAVARSLGLTGSADAPVHRLLENVLGGQRRLLVLDNFEQVLDAAAFVHDLLLAAPGLAVLVTSRAPLRVSGEQTFEVGPLALPSPGTRSRTLPAAVRLFVDRARAVKPDFELGPSNIDEVEQICVRLEGVPLAIELAAARVRILAPATLLDRLDRQLALLVGGQRDLPPRQQALRSTIEWSAKLLTPDALALLSELAVFRGPFSLEAAECVADDGSARDTLGLLAAILDSSLLRQQERDGRTLFGMLTIVREYALELLDAGGSGLAVRERHARFYSELAAAAQLQLTGPDQVRCLTELAHEHDNIRLAVRFLIDSGRHDDGAELMWRLFRYWWAGGRTEEVRGWTRDLLTGTTELSDRASAIAHFLSAAVDTRHTPTDRAMPALQRSVELFTRAGDPIAQAQALATIGFARTNLAQPDPAGARHASELAFELFQRHGAGWGRTMVLLTLGRADLLDGRPDDAVRVLRRCLDGARAGHDEFTLTLAQQHLASAYLMLDDGEHAEKLLVDSLRSSSRLGHQEGVAYAMEGFAVLAGLRGRTEEAGILSGAAAALREKSAVPPPDRLADPNRVLAETATGPDAADFERGVTAGWMMTRDEALAAARTAVAASDG